MIPMQSPIEWTYILISIRCDTYRVLCQLVLVQDHDRVTWRLQHLLHISASTGSYVEKWRTVTVTVTVGGFSESGATHSKYLI